MTKQTKENIIGWTAAIVGMWLFCSVLGSAVITDNGNCDKNYPVDDVLFIKMFCEIKE